MELKSALLKMIKTTYSKLPWNKYFSEIKIPKNIISIKFEYNKILFAGMHQD